MQTIDYNLLVKKFVIFNYSNIRNIICNNCLRNIHVISLIIHKTNIFCNQDCFWSYYINNDYITGIGLGIAVYIITLFVLILAGKSLGRLFSYTGMGSVDKVFGFFFGIFKGYVFVVCIFSILNWFYSYNKWGMSLKNSYFFPITEKGSKLLIQEFPERKDIENTKKEIENI